MIFDEIVNWPLYFKNPIFKEIFDRLNKIEIETENGIYFRGSGYYFKVMSYETKDYPEVIESHRKEVDIQLVLNYSEKIRIHAKENLEEKRIYSPNDDCVFYKVQQHESHVAELILSPGKMAVFFADDIHQPQFNVGDNINLIKKIVIKVDEKFFSFK